MRLLLRVLVIGFAAVILLLLAAAAINLNNTRSLTATAAGLVSDQLTITRLLDEVEREQGVLNAAFYRLSRTPENVDRERVLADLDRNDQVIDQLVKAGSTGPDREAWQSLRQATEGFATEARGLLSARKLPEAGSRDLFFRHEDVTAEVARLVDLSYARAAETQKRLERQSERLARESTLLVGVSFLVALVCAAFTVRLAARVFRQMEDQSTELSRVSFRLLEAQESTARRFAHELHDELGGSLTAIKTNLGFLAAGIPQDRARLDDCTRLVEESISNVRELSQLLRPTILDDFGLDAGLRWLAGRFQERTRIPVHYSSGFDGRLPDETETHLFRIVQEALTNIARHSGATEVSIQVERADSAIRLRVADNGRGLAVGPHGARPNGMGLSGMQARARSAGGQLTVKSENGHGLTIEVWAPVAGPTPAEARA